MCIDADLTLFSQGTTMWTLNPAATEMVHTQQYMFTPHYYNINPNSYTQIVQEKELPAGEGLCRWIPRFIRPNSKRATLSVGRARKVYRDRDRDQ